MKATDLVFHKTHNAPDMVCVYCGDSRPALFMASIPLDDDGDESGDTYSIAACSSFCVVQFKNHQLADKYVEDGLAKVRALRDPNAG